MIFRWRVVWFGVALALGAGCTEPCPPGGEAFEHEGSDACFYRGSIVIEGGFDCPAHLPVRTDLPDGTMCTASPVGDPARDLPDDVCRRTGLSECGAPDITPPTGPRYATNDESLDDGVITYIPFDGPDVVDVSVGRTPITTPGSYDSGPEIGTLGPVFTLAPSTGFFLPIDATAGSQRFTLMFVLAPPERHPGDAVRIFDFSKQATAGCGDAVELGLDYDSASSSYRVINHVACNDATDATIPAATVENADGSTFLFVSFDGTSLRTRLGHITYSVEGPAGGRDPNAFYIGAQCNGGVCDGRGSGAALLSFAMWTRVLSDGEMRDLRDRGTELVNASARSMP